MLGTSILKINTSLDILLGLSKTFPPFFPLETIHSLQLGLKRRDMLFEGLSGVLYSNHLQDSKSISPVLGELFCSELYGVWPKTSWGGGGLCRRTQ